MPYTINPEEKHAKAYGNNLRMSTKSSVKLTRVIRGKKLTVVKRMLNDLHLRKRSLDGKYYSKASKEFISLLNSCEKNADNLGLDKSRLFVHASAHTGRIFKRRRRKAGFGSEMKSTNLEMVLIEK